jgi:S-(hydroxymethyl)glutathione dehydrogenase/alcohol dehydrogenase
MKNKAAAYFEGDKDWTIVETDLQAPRAGEVRIKMAAAGLCHSDDHTIKGISVVHDPANGIIQFPTVGGHEGAGVVVEVGAGVTSVEPGDHVITSWIPSCGRCRACVDGMQMLCDLGANLQNPGAMRDKARHHYGDDVLFTFGLGTFSENVIADETMIVKIEKDIPLDIAALCGCCVLTGWGSSVNRAKVKVGDVVVVVGCGGVGSAAVQGARMAGARYVVAVDPVPFKREKALGFGATHTAESVEAALPIVADISWGEFADAVIMTPSTLFGDLIQPAMELVRKGGVLVTTAVAPIWQHDIKLDLFSFAMSNKTMAGCVYGQCNPRSDIPRVLKLWREGRLNLEDMITTRYRLEDVNRGYEDLHEGKNIRGIIDFSL